MARPRKDTEQTVKKLCDALSLGATYELACRYAGIGSSTLRTWRLQADQTKPGSQARQLIARLEQAETTAALRWLGQIEQAARDGAWQASAWRLERRYPQDYGRQVVQHEGSVALTSAPEWQQLRTSIMAALAPYPEVRAQLADLLTQAQEHRNGTSTSH
jgi:hypothetical protein